MKKILVKKTLLLAFMLAMMSMASAQNVTIPDANFKAALLAHDPVIDSNLDGEIQVSEAEAFTGLLNVSSKSIADLTGIEAFVNLTKLNAASNSLTSLDVSSLTKLTFLIAGINQLSSLDLSNNVLLDTMNVVANNLTTLDLSNNTGLIFLAAHDNPIPNLNVSTLSGLKFFAIGSASTTTIDVSGNTALETLIVFEFPETSAVDLSNNIKLKTINYTNCGTTSLDLSGVSSLTDIRIFGNTSLTSLDIANGNNTNLNSLYLTDNTLLTCVNVDNPGYASATFITPGSFPYDVDPAISFEVDCSNPSLYMPDAMLHDAILANYPTVDADANGIISLNEAGAFSGFMDLSNAGIRNITGLEAFTGLTGLNISGNQIVTLDVSANTNLASLNASNAGIKILTVNNGNNSNFTVFDATGNADLTCITVDDVTFSTTNWTSIPAGAGFSTDCTIAIPDANFKTALVSTIDTSTDGEIQISEAKAVTTLNDLYNLQIDDLTGIEAFINLEELTVGDASIFNGINVTDFSQNARLVKLDLRNNRFNSIDLSLMKNLREFDAQSIAQLSTLDVSNNINLSTLIIRETNITSIDLSQNKFLTTFNARRFSAGAPGFATLDLSNNPNLVTVDLTNNPLTSITLPPSGKIETLSLANNQLTSLDVSMLPNLRSLNVFNNALTELDIRNGNNSNFISFSAADNAELTCISVDDADYAVANFTNVDAGVGFDEDCNDPVIDFSDANFKAALLANVPAVDANADGDIRISEARGFTGVLNLSGQSISDVTGLEYFTAMTGIDVSNNQITSLSVKNGNNVNFTVFDARGNAGLSCIGVDNVAYSEANWTNIDPGMSFSFYCNASDIVYIPDVALKARMVSIIAIDPERDGEVTYGEALGFTGSFSTGNSNQINDMTGIEAFENMTGLTVWISSPASLSELNLTTLTKLTSLTVNVPGGLSGLDLSQNVLLENLDISRIPMQGIDLSMFPNLVTFDCNTCGLSSLDVSQNALTYLSLYNNSLTEIDLSSNTALTDLYLDYNELNALDLTGLTNLERLSASGNNFTSLDVSNQTNLKTIELLETKVVSLDLTHNNLLERVDIYGGQDDGSGGVVIGELQEIFFPPNPLNLWYVDLVFNKIQDIDISTILEDPNDTDGPVLSSVFLDDNDLQSINIGKVHNLSMTNNPDLTCATTTDPVYAEANYSYDAGVSFTTAICANPTDITLSNSVIDENSAVGTLVGTLSTVDASIGDVHTYTFAAGTNDNESFNIINGNELVTSEVLDYENSPIWLVDITTNDGNGGTFTKQLTINLNDLNETPTDIALDNANINESNPIGTVVGVLSTTDEDAVEVFTYILKGGVTDNASFEINGDELVTSVELDFETKSAYTVEVIVTDKGGLTFEKAFVVAVNDLPAQVTSIELDNATVNENESAGTLVGTLSTFGEDLSGSYTYSFAAILGNNDDDSFTISGNQLLTSGSFNFELKNSYELRIKTDNGTGNNLTLNFIIMINDVSEAPTAISLSASAIAENNAVGDVIGTLSTIDEDAGETYTYSLVAGTGSTDNASFSIVGDELRANAIFDYESQTSLSIRVETNDGNGGTFQKAFTITILNENESILVANPIADQNLDERFATLDIDLSSVFSDQDGDALTYNVSSSNTSIVTVNEAAGILTITEVGAFGSSTITVTADDGSGITTSDVFTVTVNNVNDTPVVVNAIKDQEVSEDFGSLQLDLTNVFSDEDGDDLILTVTSGDESIATATISGTMLTIAEVGIGISTITVTANDGNGGSVSNEFTITITESVLGLEDQLNIAIYPNPASDYLKIDSDLELKATLYDLNGKVLKIEYGRSIYLDIKPLSKGIYLIILDHNNEQIRKRIIKTN